MKCDVDKNTYKYQESIIDFLHKYLNEMEFRILDGREDGEDD